MNKFFHPYHLVSESPWPILSSLTLIIFMMSILNWFNFYYNKMLFFSFFLLLMILIQWWRDITRESTYQGNHTFKILKGLKLSMILFIISEIMFFLSFFWTYFHMFLSPNIEIGSMWPPKNLLIFNPLNIPLLNTLILLSSGISITWCHYSILKMNYKNTKMSFLLTLTLGTIFLLFQYMEYNESYFSMSDSIYGAIFFLITGFHGMHVLIGTLFILIMYFRFLKIQFSPLHHFGFEAASWYWHFVDVIWLFLYIFIYWLSY